ncbi:MAG TPA: 6-phosphogluconolactonase [Pyrinomonadaceae bacterium]
MDTTVHISENILELTKLAAEHFVDLAVASVREKGLFTVALSGGSTPKSLYSLLASETAPFRAQLPWGEIAFFWGDERHVPPDHPDSNYRMAWDAMLSHVPVPTSNIHRIKSEYPDAGKVAEEYETELCTFLDLPSERLPRFDLILLGMGSDGHIASLFPGSPVTRETKKLVAAVWIDKLQSSRITLTPPVLINAASAFFLVSGAAKAVALHKVLEGDEDFERLPAQVMRTSKGSVRWFVDQSAAALLHGQNYR